MVTDGEEGMIVPVGDPKRLCDKILELALDRGKTEEMGGRAFKKFTERYRADVFAAKFERLYHEVTGTKAMTTVTKRDEALLWSLMEVLQQLRDMQKRDQELQKRDQELAQVYSSASWRLTRPFRWLGDSLKGRTRQ